MNVKQLKELLSDYPDDMEVKIEDTFFSANSAYNFLRKCKVVRGAGVSATDDLLRDEYYFVKDDEEENDDCFVLISIKD